MFSLPGGGPQGSLLGLFLFLVLINDVGYSGQVNNVGDLITRKKKIKEMNVIHLKYVDDLAIAEGVNMKTQLTTVPLAERPQPDTFRARTGHQLDTETSKVFSQLKQIQKYSQENKMKLNVPKTKLMLFNPCRTKDFMPEMKINNTRIELVEQARLLGVILTSNLSWSANTESIVERCNKKMWMLRRLKKLGASRNDLLDVFMKQIRSVAEFAVPVWNSALTGQDISSLERIQKIALHIILADQYISYNVALKTMGLVKLSTRRRKICMKFANKAQKNSKFSKWFRPNLRRNTRLKQPRFCTVVCRKQRFEKSPISYLTRLLKGK